MTLCVLSTTAWTSSSVTMHHRTTVLWLTVHPVMGIHLVTQPPLRLPARLGVR